MDFTGGAYIKKVEYNDINLVPNKTFGENNGYYIDYNSQIKTFKAIAVSYDSFDGSSWENPYFDAWVSLFEGKKYSDDLVAEVTIKELNNENEKKETDTENQDSFVADGTELYNEIEKQECRVVSTKYIVQSEKYKSIYPDMLQAVLKNDSTDDIKDAIVAFVAWDSNGLPVKIKGNIDFSGGSYVVEVNFNDINLVPGKTYGEKQGYSLDSNNTIDQFKAIVVSYSTFEGKTWENPLYEEWKELFEGKRIEQ